MMTFNFAKVKSYIYCKSLLKAAKLTTKKNHLFHSNTLKSDYI